MFNQPRPYIIFDDFISLIEIGEVRKLLNEIHKRVLPLKFLNWKSVNVSSGYIREAEYTTAFMVTLEWLVIQKPLYLDIAEENSTIIFLSKPAIKEYPSAEERFAALLNLTNILKILKKTVKEYGDKKWKNGLTEKEQIIFQKAVFHLNISTEMKNFIEYMDRTETLSIPPLIRGFLVKAELKKLNNILSPEDQYIEEINIKKKPIVKKFNHFIL